MSPDQTPWTPTQCQAWAEANPPRADLAGVPAYTATTPKPETLDALADAAGDWGPFAQQLALWYAIAATCADYTAQAGVRAYTDELTAAAAFPATIGDRPEITTVEDAAEIAQAEYRRWVLQGRPLLVGGILCALSAVRAEANAARWRADRKGTVGRELIDLFDAGLGTVRDA